jgi:hypothetical protein
MAFDGKSILIKTEKGWVEVRFDDTLMSGRATDLNPPANIWAPLVMRRGEQR